MIVLMVVESVYLGSYGNGCTLGYCYETFPI